MPDALAPRTTPLAHPLPSGVRDLLPGEAEEQRALAERVIRHVTLWGYELVVPPAFELAEVLERGLGTLDAADVLRFIEPESGFVAALRPDMTPQIARLVATRLAREPLPLRLAYEGTVVRRRQGRARRHRQIAQAGVELVGSPGIEGDLEILRLAGSLLDELGLDAAVIDLGHAGVARALLEHLPAALADVIASALARKDAAEVRAIARAESASLVPTSLARVLEELPALHAGGDVDATRLFARGHELLDGTAAAGALRELEALHRALEAEPSLGRRVRVDLGEVRGFAYYTGTIFHVLADGPGEPIGAGGRYDDLLPRFDVALGAVGFGLHLDATSWARRTAGLAEPPHTRVVVADRSDDARALEAALRARGIVAARVAPESAEAYARAGRYSVIVRREGAALVARKLDASGSEREMARGAADVLAAKLSSGSEEDR